MKRSDYMAIILIASVSMLVAYFIADALIGSPNTASVKVPTIQSMSSDVDSPDPTVFNKDAINPTVEVLIGGQAKPVNGR